MIAHTGMWCHEQGQEDGKASREDLEARLGALTVKAKAAAEVCAAAEVRASTAEAARNAAEAARLAAERVRRWRHVVHYRRCLFLLTHAQQPAATLPFQAEASTNSAQADKRRHMSS